MVVKIMKRLALGLAVMCCVCFSPEAAESAVFAAAGKSVALTIPSAEMAPSTGSTLAVASSATVSSADSIKVVLDGVELQFDVQPMLVNDRTMVPMRAIFEALGAGVFWDDANNIVTAIKVPDVIKAQIGYEYIQINNDIVKMDVAPVEVNGRTLVPARFISEALGCDVKWDDLNNTVLITSGAGAGAKSYELAEKLLINRAKIIRLGHIAHYNGQVYAAEYLCMPGWNPVKCNYVGAFAIHNDKIYRTDGNGTGDESTNMYSTSLDGSDEVFIDIVENWGGGTYIIGDRLVYTGFDDDGETYMGLRIFDTNTAEKVDLPIYGKVISFDDEYLYLLVDENEAAIGETTVKEYWRARWDGSLVEKANDLNGIPVRYFDSYNSSGGGNDVGGGGGGGEDLYFLVRGHEPYAFSAGFYDDGVIGVLIVAIDGLEWKLYNILASNNDDRVNDSVFIYDGWVYYYKGPIIYKRNLYDGPISKVSSMHPDIQLEIASFIDIIDGYIYMRGYTGDESGPNMALFRIPVNGGTMERTEMMWYES